MNKRLLLILILPLLLGGCSIKKSNSSTSQTSLSYYKSTLKELENLRKSNTSLAASGNSSRVSANIKSYYEKYKELIIKTKNDLNDSAIYQEYVNDLGLEETEYILSIDTDRFFYLLDIPSIDTEALQKKGKNILSEIENKGNSEIILSEFEEYIGSISTLSYASNLAGLFNDLYYTDGTYDALDNDYDVALQNVSNDYYSIFQKLLGSDYKEETITKFELSDEEVSYFLNHDVYSEEIMTLMNEETTLVNQYDSNGSVAVENQLYLDLVNKRNELARALGYSNYLEYAYTEIYDRDYTYAEAQNLIDNIRKNKELKNIFQSMNYASVPSKRIGEYEILNVLKYASNIQPKASKVLKDMDTYGRFSFEKRNNKFTNSYMTNILNNRSESFIFLSADGLISDIPAAFHEFGHYLEAEVNKERESDPTNLDLAEINSQGMQYLSMNYYNEFLTSEETNILTNNEIFDSLWTIYSACAVADFENYVYTCSDLTLNKMQKKINENVNEFTYPYSFGTSGNNYIYCSVPHIYLSGGYYISYLTSIIPSLELWADDSLENAISKYNYILESGFSKPFKETLSEAGLTSPFEEEAITLIYNKMKTI